MMAFPRALPIIAACLISACGMAGKAKPYATTVDEVALAPYAQKGTASIKGQAFLKTRGGDVKPCAGETVVLMPAVPYTAEYLARLVNDEKAPPLDPRVVPVQRQTTGDGQGNFAFADLPAGDYFAACRVSWMIYGQSKPESGVAWAKVSLTEGQAVTNLVATR